ncbi:hypothetical protein [Paenibacillus cellulositrophicus]|uniref:hypothetical protein n=1 Tax=Paenibacillus cellulositrophicus TaxID=562959 RepID=UPI003D978519
MAIWRSCGFTARCSPRSGVKLVEAEIGSAATSFRLRAEKSRTYTITYTPSDQAGNRTARTVTVTVPHDQSGDSSNIDGAEKSLRADEKASMAEL